MSVNLIDKPRASTSKRYKVSHTVIDRRRRRDPMRCYSIPPVTDDEERKFVAAAVTWMAVLAITPLILFHILNFLYPDFLLISIVPNQAGVSI